MQKPTRPPGKLVPEAALAGILANGRGADKNGLDNERSLRRRCVYPLFRGVEDLQRLDARLLP